MVSGHEGVKARLRRAAQAILAGRLRGVPMGYLIAGPVGSAKTFLVNCFTGEIGFPCVKFLNFRSQWQGVTEGNLEKILKLLHAMWPVGVIIDEADAFLGDRNQQGDSGTSNRVFAQLASFMGNTEYRGKIVWFLITCRPDLLPVDLKRQGRAEEHLALFYPQTDEEHDALFRIMLKKSGLQTDGARRSREVIDDPERPVGRRHRGDPGARAARRPTSTRDGDAGGVGRGAAAAPSPTSFRRPARSNASCRFSSRCRNARRARCCRSAIAIDGSRRACSRASTNCARCLRRLTAHDRHTEVDVARTPLFDSLRRAFRLAALAARGGPDAAARRADRDGVLAPPVPARLGASPPRPLAAGCGGAPPHAGSRRRPATPPARRARRRRASPSSAAAWPG